MLSVVVAVSACGETAVSSTGTSPSERTTPPSTASLAGTSADTSLPGTSLAGETTTTEAASITSPATDRRSDGEAVLQCERLPTVYEVVEMPLDGSEVEVFDLATAADVDTFRIRATGQLPVDGEYHNGFLHYVVTAQGLESEWLVGPDFDVRVLAPTGWQSPDELTISPWFHADPSWAYAGSLAALDQMEFVRWEVVEHRDAAVFEGGMPAIASYFGDEELQPGDEMADSAGSAEIWMSPDCYPFRVHLELQLDSEEAVIHWELYDLDAPITFDIPEDMLE